MGIFYKVFRCLARNIILDNDKLYHKIFCYIFTTDGNFIGIYQKDNCEDVDTMAIHPDGIFCCCCSCFNSIYK